MELFVVTFEGDGCSSVERVFSTYELARKWVDGELHRYDYSIHTIQLDDMTPETPLSVAK